MKAALALLLVTGLDVGWAVLVHPTPRRAARARELHRAVRERPAATLVRR